MPNIIDIGFDWKKAEADKERILSAMEEILEVGTRMSKVKFSFGPGIQEFKKLNDEVRRLASDLTKAVDMMSKALKTNSDERKKNSQTAAQQIKEEKELVKLMQEEEKLEQQQLKTKKLKTQESANATKQAAQEKKMADELADEYAQLSKAYNEAARKAKNYALVLGESHPSTVAAVKDAKEMHDILLRVDQSVGQSQRNVGNYKSAFDGLTMSVAQISRELPSLTVSVQQFALAISNNLPMFADEIAKAKVEIAALKAEGKEAPSLLSRIGSSILSWQVGLSIGITLLTAFAGRIGNWLSGLFDADAALKKAQESQQKLNDAIREQLELEKRIDDAYNNTDLGNTQKYKNDLAFARALNKEKGEQLEIERKLVDEQAQKASQLFNEKGGYDLLKQAHEDLTAAQVDYNTKFKEYQQMLTSTPEAGEEFISGTSPEKVKEQLDGLKKVLDQKVDDYNTIKKVNEDFANTMQAQNAKYLEIEEFKASEARKLALETIRIEKSETIDKNDKVLANEKSTLYQRIVALRQSLAARKAIIEAEKNNILNDPSSTSVDKAVAIKKAGAEMAKAERDTGKAIFDIKQEFYNRSLQAKYDTDRILLESDQSTQERIYTNEIEGLEKRLTALNKHSEDQRALVEKEFAFQKELLDQKATTDEEYVRLEADKDAKLIELTARTQKMMTDIIQQTNQRLQNDQNSINNAFYKFILQTNLADVERAQAYAADVVALNKLLQAKKISITQYEQQRAAIEEKYSTEILESNIQKQKDLIKAKKANDESVWEDEKRLAEMEMALDDKTTNRKLDNQRKIREATKALYEETLTMIQTIVDAGYQKEVNAIQEKMDKSDEFYQREIENVNNSTLSEEDKANRIKILEAQQKITRDRYEKEQRQAQERQAKFDKAIQIAKIIGNTAIGVTAALTSIPPNLPLSLLIGALGAVQLATVIARPIPKYATGTEDHPGGLAYLGDGGEHELVETPGGNRFVSPNTTTLYNLPKGSRVTPFSSDKINEAMHRAMIIGTAGMIKSGKLAAAKKEGEISLAAANMIVRAIEKNKPKPAKPISKEAIRAAIQLEQEKNKWRYGN